MRRQPHYFDNVIVYDVIMTFLAFDLPEPVFKATDALHGACLPIERASR